MYGNEYDLPPSIESLKEDFHYDVGVILSYGTGQEIIPVGAFSVSNIIRNGEDAGNIDSYLVELTRILYISYHRVEDFPDDKMYIPLGKFLKLLGHKANVNKNIFYEITGHDPYTSSLSYLDFELQEVLKNHNEGKGLTSPLRAKTIPTEELDVRHYYKGQLMGDNYSLAPFSLGKILRKTFPKTM